MSYDVWVYVAARENSQMRVALMWVLDDTDSSKLTSKAHERRRKLISEVARTHYTLLQFAIVSSAIAQCCLGWLLCKFRLFCLPPLSCPPSCPSTLLCACFFSPTAVLLLLLRSASFEMPLLTITLLLLSFLAANLLIAAIVLCWPSLLLYFVRSCFVMVLVRDYLMCICSDCNRR